MGHKNVGGGACFFLHLSTNYSLFGCFGQSLFGGSCRKKICQWISDKAVAGSHAGLKSAGDKTGSVWIVLPRLPRRLNQTELRGFYNGRKTWRAGSVWCHRFVMSWRWRPVFEWVDCCPPHTTMTHTQWASHQRSSDLYWPDSSIKTTFFCRHKRI